MCPFKILILTIRFLREVLESTDNGKCEISGTVVTMFVSLTSNKMFFFFAPHLQLSYKKGDGGMP